MESNVNQSFNHMMEVTKSVKEVHVVQSLEKTDKLTLHLDVTVYYLLMKEFTPALKDSMLTHAFKQNLQKYMDKKFWTSLLHFIGWLPSWIQHSSRCNSYGILECEMPVTTEHGSNKGWH